MFKKISANIYNNLETIAAKLEAKSEGMIRDRDVPRAYPELLPRAATAGLGDLAYRGAVAEQPQPPQPETQPPQAA
jgi:hypothetical protein